MKDLELGEYRVQPPAPRPMPVVARPQRRRLPKRRASRTTSFRVAQTDGYLTAGQYPDGRLGEIFLMVAKQGSTLSGIMDAFAISVSLGLQYGVPLEAYVEKFTSMRFDPAGATDDPHVPDATSIMDYVFRRLAADYLDAPVTHEPAPSPVVPKSVAEDARLIDAPLCYNCGNKMRPAGSCYVCESCGSTSGCS